MKIMDRARTFLLVACAIMLVLLIYKQYQIRTLLTEQENKDKKLEFVFSSQKNRVELGEASRLTHADFDYVEKIMGYEEYTNYITFAQGKEITYKDIEPLVEVVSNDLAYSYCITLDPDEVQEAHNTSDCSAIFADKVLSSKYR